MGITEERFNSLGKRRVEAEMHTVRVIVEQLSGGRCRKGKLDDGLHGTHSGSIVVR